MLIFYCGGQRAYVNPERKIDALTHGAQEKTHGEIAAALSDPYDHVTITMIAF